MVITKSISRFARNTVDSLTNIRKLKEKNIAVFFEKEGINTLEGSGELLITILSSQAQEESRNISENCHWGIVRRFEAGQVIVNHNKFLGYTKDKDGNLVVVPEEAELVRRIYRLFLEGNSSYRIKRILESEGIRTVTGNTVWQATVIDKMLTNEKYMGDALLQKTYTVDFLTKKKVVNKGIVPQYYIEDDHEAIIPKELFYRVQEEKARRGNIYRAAIKKRGERRRVYKGVIEYFKNRIMAGELRPEKLPPGEDRADAGSQPQFRWGSAADHGYDGSDFLPAGIGELHHL